jgi:hypothetical protein
VKFTNKVVSWVAYVSSMEAMFASVNTGTLVARNVMLATTGRAHKQSVVFTLGFIT